MTEVEKFMITIVGEETRVEELFKALEHLKSKGYISIWDCNRESLRTSNNSMKVEK